ncbi:neurotrophin-7-like [Varroa destructor]|uniref:Nerve growth factor-related domain-containing protein n=1 Tax=Varroa destructor TaxID=109461 RepID=A0A7M7KAE6_VARDE|nr:neurotrophin-7-like [Varroa destructor]
MTKIRIICVSTLLAVALGHRSASYDLNTEEIIMGKQSLDEQLASIYERDQVNMELPVRKGLVRFAVDKPQLKRSTNVPKGNFIQGKSVNSHVGFQNGNLTSNILNGALKRAESSKTREVCPSFSDWVIRTEAEDPYGNRVTVLEHVPINGTLVRQYFYETFCHATDSTEENPRPLDKNQHRECLGIDKGQWNSRCRENYIWTYGKVLKDDGKIGWSVIAIRGSCSCGVSRKGHRLGNYFDEFIE